MRKRSNNPYRPKSHYTRKNEKWQVFERFCRHIKAEFGYIEIIPMLSLFFMEIKESDQDEALRIASRVLGIEREKLKSILSKCDTFARNITLKAPDGTVLLENGEYVGGGEDA